MSDIIFFTLLGLVFFFGLYRNHWVYSKRIWLIDNNWENYNNYQSYDYMFLHFWVWDIEKFKKGE